MTPRDQLQTVAEIVNRHAAPELASWFSDGVQDFITGRQRTLCKALGCRAAGHCAPATETAIRARNRHLQAAFILVECPPDATTLDRVRELAGALERFRAIIWRWSRDHPAPPLLLGALDTELWHALKTGAPIPASERQWRRIVLPA